MPLVRTSVGIVAPSIHWNCVLLAGQALLHHAELNAETLVLRRLFRSGACSEKSICQALAIVQAQGFCQMEMGFVLSNKITQVPRSAHRTTLGTCQYGPDQWRELLANRRILREFHANTDTVEDSPRKMFGCAAIITGPLVDDPSGRFANAASAHSINNRDPASIGLRASTC